ncbi:protein LURP-one-related 5-like [Triticum dicoccoides]|uniref:protein LURP-one-related 5-like n=1 Tax=Triticum dicoccoides TaxID=85692 RepID=UPI00188E2297|nr:protein LURP-one-related 5-like [Triticum dicoccoides]
MVMAEPEETPGSQRPSADRGSVAGEPSPPAAATPRRLTVWCKSLVFRGDGYAVFDDADGRMVFRVDNYGVGPGSMALMDHAGRVLLTLRRRQRKMLSLMPETWEVYNGDVDDDSDANDGHDEPHLMMRATKDLGRSSCTASMLAVDKPELYRLSWSRREEWSRIHRRSSTGNETLIAEVRRKRGGPEKATLLGKDVLSLVVQPGMDLAITMAMLMISNSYR